ncbi:hypothetical protein [Plantactinospora sp. B24E8]|uniref:hypothetical protein n=1 Tax=Plantactinospora sp. B24E8 TaxID=3153567 RepID=UPI00325E0E7A
MSGSHRLRFMPIIGIMLGLSLLTGCAIDKGSALAADFAEDWAGTPDVVDVQTTKNNTLPFLGTATGTLTVGDGTPADRVAGLAEEMRKYVAAHDNVTGQIAADGITFIVVADRERATETVTLWRSLAADDRVTGADIDDVSSKDGDGWRIEIISRDAGAALAIFKDMVADGDRHQPLSDVTDVKVGTASGGRPGLVVQTDHQGTVPTDAIAAYEAVRARSAIVRASLEPDRARIVVAAGADREHAEELARAAAPSLGAALEVVSDRDS